MKYAWTGRTKSVKRANNGEKVGMIREEYGKAKLRGIAVKAKRKHAHRHSRYREKYPLTLSLFRMAYFFSYSVGISSNWVLSFEHILYASKWIERTVIDKRIHKLRSVLCLNVWIYGSNRLRWQWQQWQTTKVILILFMPKQKVA